MSLKKKKEVQEKAPKKPLIKRRKPNRSVWGDFFLYLFLAFVALVMAFPIIYAVNSALKPLDELFMFPPKIFAQNPTMDNFSDLFVTMGKSWVTFSRYLFNTVFITAVGTAGHLIVASMGAFVLAKYEFPGGQGFFKLVTVAMMFSGYVTAIPNYLILNALGWIDTYWAIVIPAFASPMGLFLMKQFMEQLPDSLMESARLDGANELTIFWKIVMPNVKPAWLTLAIFQFQQMWSNTGALFLRDEQLKPLQFSLQQITAGGTARAGAAAAVTFLIAAVPIIFFLICQRNVLETMTTSGMKD